MEVWNSCLLLPPATISKAQTWCQIFKSPLAAKSLSHFLLLWFPFFDWPREGSWWLYEVDPEPGEGRWAVMPLAARPWGAKCQQEIRGCWKVEQGFPMSKWSDQPCTFRFVSENKSIPQWPEQGQALLGLCKLNRTNWQSLENNQSSVVLTLSEGIKNSFRRRIAVYYYTWSTYWWGKWRRK